MRRAIPAVMAAVVLCFALPLSAAGPAAPGDELAAYRGASPECRTALEKALALAGQGKWRSAVAALEAYDPKDADPFSLAMKTRLFLEGYIQSDMHRSFGIKDLEPGEDLAELRGAEQGGDLIPFDPQALADAQAAAKTPAPPILSKELGDYYYDVQAQWSGQWTVPDENIYGSSLVNYIKAYEGGVYDATSLHNQGEILMRFERAAEAEPLLVKSIELDPIRATTRYNYAICLILIGKKVEALDQLDKAIDLLPNPSAQFEAIALGARTAAEAGQNLKTEAYLDRGERLLPDDPTPGLLRHFIALSYQDAAAASAAADALMEKFPGNPVVVRGLVSTWYSMGKPEGALAFLERRIALAAPTDDLSLGSLKFYVAVLLSQGEPSEEDRAKGLSYLEQAEAHIGTAAPNDPGFAQAIATIRAKLQPQAQQAGEAAPKPTSP